MTAEELVDAEHALSVDIPVKTPAGQWNLRMKILKSLARTEVRADALLPSLPGLKARSSKITTNAGFIVYPGQMAHFLKVESYFNVKAS